MRTKNPRFNRIAPIVCGVPRCDTDITPHTNRFSTRVPTRKPRVKPHRITRDLRINMFYRTRCINTPAPHIRISDLIRDRGASDIGMGTETRYLIGLGAKL